MRKELERALAAMRPIAAIDLTTNSVPRDFGLYVLRLRIAIDAAESAIAAPAAEPVAWRVRLVCCGSDDGLVLLPTWEQADSFRESYTSGADVHPHGYSAHPSEYGHKRAAIVEALYAEPVARKPLTDDKERI